LSSNFSAVVVAEAQGRAVQAHEAVVLVAEAVLTRVP
jgi:hypothetical protein